MSKLKSLNNLISAIKGETVEAKTMQEALKNLIEVLGGSSEVKDDTITELLNIIAEIAPGQIGGSPTSYFSNKFDSYSGGSLVKKLPDNITLDQEITELNGFFYNWNKITTIPLFDTSNVTNMAWMFEGCTNLTSVPELNTASVEKFEGMFSGCSNLVTVPQFNGVGVVGSSAELLQHMFDDCSKLSNESLNNILGFLTSCTNFTGTKTLRHVGLTSGQATTCQSLSNYEAFTAAGWTTGY